MPELPEVAAFKVTFDHTSLGRKIRDVSVRAGKVLAGVSAKRLRRTLVGRRFISSRQHGKNLLVEVEGDGWLRFHFGMTGHFDFVGRGGSFPRYARVVVTFTGGGRLVFVCLRRLGCISLERSPEEFVRKEHLGPHALDLARREFRAILQHRRGALKSTLMNQSVIAGLGNIYVDEILFQARRHPKSTFADLADEELDDLHRVMRRVLTRAVRLRADWGRLPRSWLLHRRRRGARCPRCGTPIGQVKIGGRSTYFCPACQPARENAAAKD